MTGSMILILPEKRTVSRTVITDSGDIRAIIKPDYGVTAIRLNKYGDLLHFDAQRSEVPRCPSFQMAGYLSKIFGVSIAA